MRKSVLAALAAVLVLAGVARADYIKKVTSEEVNSKRVNVSKVDRDLGEGEMYVEGASTFVGAVTASGGVTGAVTSTAILGPVPATQVIAAAGTIAADACGGIKNISSAAAVTTNTTNTFTAPATANKGCIMQVCNANATDAITLDDNALFNASGIAGGTPGDTVLGALDCVSVGSTGSVWNQLAAGSQN